MASSVVFTSTVYLILHPWKRLSNLLEQGGYHSRAEASRSQFRVDEDILDVHLNERALVLQHLDRTKPNMLHSSEISATTNPS